MRLLSATVRNYRIHRETAVDFADSLNVIGGPNESGKSTLAEAIHRALFLKSTIGGKVQESMVSDTHQGHPEVEVRFSVSGKNYEIRKTFSKASGKATLSETGGETLHGADAELKLAALLRVEESGGGTGGANKSLAQWGHLWVWQGQGGADPSEHAAPQRDALLSRLKDEGGGAAMQSALDSAVAAEIETKYAETFTGGGSVKAGSDLRRAEEEKANAEEATAKAESIFVRLEQAVRDFGQADVTIRSHKEKSAGLSRDLETARKALKTVGELRHHQEITERNFNEADTKFRQLETNISEVAKLQAQVDSLSEQLKPAAGNARLLEETAKTKKAEFNKAESALEKIVASIDQIRTEAELAGAWVELLEARDGLKSVTERKAEIDNLFTERKQHDAKRAALPAVTPDTLSTMRETGSSLAKAEAVLKATSTGIEVIRSAGDVKAGTAVLSEGTEHVIDRETLLTVGDTIELKITPGGGAGLAEARREVADLSERIKELFSKSGVDSTEEAATILTNRQTLASRIRELDAELSGRNANAIAEQSDEANRQLAATEAEVKRRSKKSPAFQEPTDLNEANDHLSELRAKTEHRDSEIVRAKAQRAAAADSLATAEAESERAKASSREAELQLNELKTRLATKSEPLGSPDVRETKRKQLRDEREQAKTKLDETRQKLAALQPDSLEADVSRLTRAIEIGKSEHEAAIGKKAAAQSILQSDGTTDPASDLAIARARLESASERHTSLERRANAIKLLHEKFSAEQQKLSDRFSRPLAEKVSSYLQQIFGPTATATVSVEDGVIGGWTMSREGGTFDFDKLSGGTREQVAAAVRLAMAEILAADHDESLPIVFDDAFTNSDPERILSLQRMLDLAARRQLQVILLTCQPESYTGLGATTVTLGSVTTS